MSHARIRKMPHHLRRVRGIFQVQMWVREDLRAIVAQINGKTAPKQTWLIRSTGTGNLNEAERIRDERILPELRAILQTAEVWADPAAIAAALNSGGHDLTFGRLGVLSKEQADAVLAAVDADWQHHQGHHDNLAMLVADIRKALPDPMAADRWRDVRSAVLGSLAANGKAAEREPVDYETVLARWRTEKRLDETDKKARQMAGKWRDLFAWLVKECGYPADCRDMARITTEDLDAYKEHLFGTTAQSKTIEDRLRQISGLINYARDDKRTRNLFPNNPIADFKIPKGKTSAANKWQDFTLPEVRLILTKARTAPPEIRWPMWLGAYSGARLAEVAEAQTNDVEIDEHGIAIFHIRRLNRPGKQATLKTGEISERPVPIHDAILAEGFLSYVESIRQLHGGEGPLFPQFKLWRGRINHDASDRLMKWLRGIGITGRRKVFHSWRHTVKTRFREMDADRHHYIEREDVADKLTGHAGGSIGRDYGAFPIPMLRANIERVPAWL